MWVNYVVYRCYVGKLHCDKVSGTQPKDWIPRDLSNVTRNCHKMLFLRICRGQSSCHYGLNPRCSRVSSLMHLFVVLWSQVNRMYWNVVSSVVIKCVTRQNILCCENNLKDITMASIWIIVDFVCKSKRVIVFVKQFSQRSHVFSVVIYYV